MFSWAFKATILISAGVFAVPLGAEAAEETWRFDTGLTLTRFEQQVKAEVGGEWGERLVEEFGVGLLGAASYRCWGPLSVGLFTRFDFGSRKEARFQAVEEGRAVIVSEVGGAYTELWVGPFVRAQWMTLFVELGYGAIGIRDDDARDDLVNENGDTESALKASRAVAWILDLGGGVPLTEALHLALRMEYRVRYYDRRGSSLADKLVHGTENFMPFIGLA